MDFTLVARPRTVALAALTALLLATPGMAARAHEFEPGDDHGGTVITTTAWPTGEWTAIPVGGQIGDDHGRPIEPDDDHGQDG